MPKRNMVSKFKKFIFLALAVGISASNILEDNLSLVIKEFQINHPIIQNKLLSQNSFIRLFKRLLSNGHSTGFCQNNVHYQYQAQIIFTRISNFNWTFQTKAPVLVVSDIQNEMDLNNVNVSISDELFFLDRNSLKVYETYQINDVQVTKFLGKFGIGKSKLEFRPSVNYLTPIVKRRNNLHGMQLNGIGETITENFPKEEVRSYSKDGKTYYDITNLQKDPKLFFAPFGIPVLQFLQKQLNFTSHLYIQKGQKLGSPKMINSNGTILIGEGIFQNLINGLPELGSPEFIWTSLTILPIRSQFVDFLIPLGNTHVAIFVPNHEVGNAIDWTVFIGPFSNFLWILIVLKCILFTILLCIIEWCHDYKIVSKKSIDILLIAKTKINSF